MPLYQPTNILPSSFAGYGNGVVDAKDNAQISWQINGTSALSAFWITIDQINGSYYDRVYSSGLRTDGCPVYGTDNNGNISLFTFSPNQTWLRLGLINNASYVFSIVQFYKIATTTLGSLVYFNRTFEDFLENTLTLYPNQTFEFQITSDLQGAIYVTEQDAMRFNNTDTVTDFYYNYVNNTAFYVYNGNFYELQVKAPSGDVLDYAASSVASDSPYYNLSYVTTASSVAFKTRAKPTVTIDNIESPVNFGKITVQATYSQEYGDAICWARWQFAVLDSASGQRTIIDDTGEVYTGELSYVCDGMTNGNTYCVNCIVESVYGVQAESGWTEFDVEYEYSASSKKFTLSCDQNDNSVVIQFTGTTDIMGVSYRAASSSYRFTNDGYLEIEEGNRITWNEQDGESLHISPADYSFWLNFNYDPSAYINAHTILSLSNTDGNVFLNLTVEPTGILSIQNGDGVTVWSYSGFSGSLDRKDLLMVIKSNSINIRYINEDGGFSIYTDTTDLTMENLGVITLIGDNGDSKFRYLAVAAPFISLNLTDITNFYYPPYITGSNGFYMLAFFGGGYNTLQAGTSSPIVQYSIYRKEQNALKSIFVGDFPANMGEIKDFGVKGLTQYQYEIFQNTYGRVYAGYVNKISLCKKIKSYTLIEAVQDEERPFLYHALNVFKFGNNIQAGSVSNNNSPSFLMNFTPYRLRQPTSRMGKSGTLQALLSNVSNGEYSDTSYQMERLFALSQSLNTLFLKDMKGNLYMVHTSSPIVQTINTKSEPQEVTVSIPWEEIGDASTVSIVQTPEDEGWES